MSPCKYLAVFQASALLSGLTSENNCSKQPSCVNTKHTWLSITGAVPDRLALLASTRCAFRSPTQCPAPRPALSLAWLYPPLHLSSALLSVLSEECLAVATSVLALSSPPVCSAGRTSPASSAAWHWQRMRHARQRHPPWSTQMWPRLSVRGRWLRAQKPRRPARTCSLPGKGLLQPCSILMAGGEQGV